MLDKTRTNLLLETIEHWERDVQQPLLDGNVIIESYSSDFTWSKPIISPALFSRHITYSVAIYWKDCPLCQKYYADSCEKCPIKMKGIEFRCGSAKSPYMNFKNNPNLANCNAMIGFLKSLH